MMEMIRSEARLRVPIGPLVAIAAVLCAVGCARPLEVEPIPISADPDRQMSDFSLHLSSARSREIDVLAPSWFARAATAHVDARELRRAGAEAPEILAAIAEGKAALAKAEASSRVARRILAGPWEARTRALRVGAASLGEPFDEVEETIRRLARALEEGDLEEARASRDALADEYAALERRAIKEQTLGKALELLARSREADADSNLPRVFEAASRSIERAEQFIDSNPHADETMAEYAEVALFHTRRVVALNGVVRLLESHSREDVALELERRMRTLGDALGLPDRRAAAMESRWIGLLSEAKHLRNDRDFLVDQNDRLRSALSTARDEVDRLAGLNRELRREAEFDERFQRASDRFDRGEAEVYRREGRLIIRLRSLDFPVGEASLDPTDFELLTKVREAIRIFGTPNVTIEGHTDSTGAAALNQHLSRERAEAVRDYLLANRVLPPHRIIAVGRASEVPLASNETAEGRALNRRIDVIIDTRRILAIAEHPEGRISVTLSSTLARADSPRPADGPEDRRASR